MPSRSELLWDISQALQLLPHVKSTVDLKERVELPPQFQSLKTIAQLESLLKWINDGKPPLPEIPKEPKKYRRKLTEKDRARIRQLVQRQVKPNYAAIGRIYGVTGQTIKNVTRGE